MGQINISKSTGNPKRRPAASRTFIDRGTRIKQYARDIDVPFQTRNEQWRIAVIILLVDAGALLKKIAYCGDVTLVASRRQWRCAALNAQLPPLVPESNEEPARVAPDGQPSNFTIKSNHLQRRAASWMRAQVAALPSFRSSRLICGGRDHDRRRTST